MSKYKITEIEHPKYPWLHRIQAVSDVNEKVPKGTLGGFIENENNLSQEGTCWIYDDAICCENGEVKDSKCRQHKHAKVHRPEQLFRQIRPVIRPQHKNQNHDETNLVQRHRVYQTEHFSPSRSSFYILYHIGETNSIFRRIIHTMRKRNLCINTKLTNIF